MFCRPSEPRRQDSRCREEVLLDRDQEVRALLVAALRLLDTSQRGK
jgi:hypothetical protein